MSIQFTIFKRILTGPLAGLEVTERLAYPASSRERVQGQLNDTILAERKLTGLSHTYSVLGFTMEQVP
jgi:hypothetical protein